MRLAPRPTVTFANRYAGALLKRVERRLRRSAKKRRRPEYAEGYRKAAAQIHELLETAK